MENRNQNEDMNRDQNRLSGMGNQSQSGSTANRGSESLGNESMGTSGGLQSDIGSPDYEVEGGDSGRGGSTGTGNTERSRDDRDRSRMGEGGM